MEEEKRVLLVSDPAGASGRDHALVLQYAKSSHVFWYSPNAAVRDMHNVVAVDSKAGSIQEQITDLIGIARDFSIDLTMVASEAWLYAGIVDRFKEEGLPIIGPSQKAALFTEQRKDFCKEILVKYGIPTAPYEVFLDHESAKAYLGTHMGLPGAAYVAKAVGEARGKGVSLLDKGLEHALLEIERIWALNPGDPILIEKRLRGQEVSYIVAVDGKGNKVPFRPVRDYKQFVPGGPMTGGIAAHTIELSKALHEKIDDSVARTVDALRDEGIPYKGILYFGLMIVEEDGEEVPYILELNCRPGDPEWQIICSALKSDLTEFSFALWEDRLDTVTLEWSDDEFAATVLASQGYPGVPLIGKVVYNLAFVQQKARVYFGALEWNEDGELVTTGGRVLTVVCSRARSTSPLIPRAERGQIALRRACKKVDDLARRISFGDPDPKMGTQQFRKYFELPA